MLSDQAFKREADRPLGIREVFVKRDTVLLLHVFNDWQDFSHLSATSLSRRGVKLKITTKHTLVRISNFSAIVVNDVGQLSVRGIFVQFGQILAEIFERGLGDFQVVYDFCNIWADCSIEHIQHLFPRRRRS